MRWGIIGTGAHAESRIAPALSKATNAVFAGAAGSSPERSRAFVSRVGDGTAYPTRGDLLADTAVDAVFIATPNDQHRFQTEAAAAAGKHVLVEKPMALSVEDCHAMIAACTRAGVALGVGFQQRHAPVHMALRKLVGSGALGDIVLARGEWHTAYPPWTNWRADPARAGSDIVSAVGVHVFDILSFVLGRDVEEVASIIDRAPQSGFDQTVAAALRYCGGPIGSVTLTRRARALVNSVSMLGTKGAATAIGSLGMSPIGRLVTVIDGNEEERDLPVVDLYAAQFEAFARSVAQGKAPDASGLDGLNSVALTRRLLAQ